MVEVDGEEEDDKQQQQQQQQHKQHPLARGRRNGGVEEERSSLPITARLRRCNARSAWTTKGRRVTR